MMANRLRASLRVILGSTALLLVCGCSTSPEERPENLDLRDKSEPLRRVIFLEVKPDSGAVYGNRAEWVGEISRVFRKLEVCTAVWTEGYGDRRRADLLVEVTVGVRAPTTDQPLPTDVQAEGAFLDFLAWSTVPLLPLWIPDVDVDPGVELKVSLRPLPEDEAEDAISFVPGEADPKCPPVRTTYLERNPVVSWSSLGAIFVPPFVFEAPDEAHFVDSVKGTVRSEVACKLAWMVKRCSPDKEAELLKGVNLVNDGASSTLTFLPHRELTQVETWLEGFDPDVPAIGEQTQPVFVKAKDYVWPLDESRQEELPLKGITPAPDSGGFRLRIRAWNSRTGKELWYSFRVSADESVLSPSRKS